MFQYRKKKDWSELKSELKAIKEILNDVMNNSALKLKAKPASTSEPASTLDPDLVSSQKPPTQCTNSGEELTDYAHVWSNGYSNHMNDYWGFKAYDRPFKEYEYWKSNYFPAVIWKRYEKAHRLQKIGFRVPEYPKNWPNVFEVVGTNIEEDEVCDTHNWTPMLRVDNGGGFKSNNEFKTFIIPVEKRTSYRCLGLRFPTGEGSSNGHTNLIQITMWEDK